MKSKVLKQVMKLLVVVVLTIAVVGCGKSSEGEKQNENKNRHQVDAGKYISVEYAGYSKLATSVVYCDYETMIKENLKAFGLSEDYESLDYRDVYTNVYNAFDIAMSTAKLDKVEKRLQMEMY